MMLPLDLLKMSLHNLLLHKIRSILTSLGVIFGVGSVIAMLAISEGAKQQALAQIEAMGIDKIIIFAKRPSMVGSAEGSENMSMVESYGLTERDLAHLSGLDNVAEVSTLFHTRNRIMRGLEYTDLKLIGCDLNFLANTPASMAKGRWFTRADFENQREVCVIGPLVKRKLFSLGATGILGRKIHVGDFVYEIIGILSNDFNTKYTELGSIDDMVLIPKSTARSQYRDYSYTTERRQFKITRVEYDLFIVRVNEIDYIDNTSKRIANYLEKFHGKSRDWEMVVPIELLEQERKTRNIFTIVMGSIAGISLIVGGIGIMNIMLASVYERRKEIGTRRALGAQKSDILLQFLIETVFLTVSGGILGIMLGYGIASGITVFSGMPTIFSMWSIILSLVISCVVGVVFGTYPAWQAAQQNPITVLRAE